MPWKSDVSYTGDKQFVTSPPGLVTVSPLEDGVWTPWPVPGTWEGLGTLPGLNAPSE